jgi:choline dehydrogenase-like flavoprotein
VSAEQAALQADVVAVGMGVGGEAVAGQLADAAVIHAG